jgi:LPS O-antigen subunit length determinant protein (WzzB/FepE family)
MKNLILALNRANLSDSDIESVLTDFENWVDSRVVRREQKMMTESIAPIQKENDGIRSEIRLLAETMKHGFAIMEERFQKMDQKWEERFQRIDQKLDFTRKNLEMQIASSRENLETQIKANDKQLSLVQKLLWLVLTLVLGLFAKAVHLF